ncbi:MAG: endonuclease/exonuclease/phosphatase family protein [Phycisphaerales bacterium]
MLGRTEIFIRRLQRQLNRQQFLFKFLGFGEQSKYKHGKGLVIIQIDSLSKQELELAISTGKMKFMKKLQQQGYKSHTFYTGVPSSTAAVQAELFYGVKAAVPAFGFFDYETNRPLVMFNPRDALEIEKRLEKQGKGLLAQGSAYSDIFTGGAKESHFCISNLSAGSILKNRYPFGFIMLVLLHFFSLIWTAMLMIFEAMLALSDFIRGLISGKNLWKELKFIPSRVAICILLRELITIGAMIDTARGLPVIHLNLVGFHEQSHRRGPTSRFARWTLKGIDKSIKRIWKAALRSTSRDYEVWIYSDHGQEETFPYEKKYGKIVQQAVSEVFEDYDKLNVHDSKKVGFLLRTGMRSAKFFTDLFTPIVVDQSIRPMLIALGPVGHIYLDSKTTLKEKHEIAEKLINQANIPAVILPCIDRKAEIWTAAGRFKIPEKADAVFDTTSPYYNEMVKDFLTACCRSDVGDLLIYGWNEKEKVYYSFANENGSHGGFNRRETEGFAFLPGDTEIKGIEKGYIRPLELRQSALDLMGRKTIKRVNVEKDTIRVMTYNVHGCVGIDGGLSPARIAKVICRYKPDIVALQELDVGRMRSGREDQAKIIAQCLNMEHHFNPTVKIEEETFGDAILSTYPMSLVKADSLAIKPRFAFLEPRGALWIQIRFQNKILQFINTHLGLNGPERIIHTKELIAQNWLGHPQCIDPVILCGDFNSRPNSQIFRMLKKRLYSAQSQAGLKKHKGTWFGRWPIICLDHILVSPELEVVKIEVADSYLARIASDHRPLIADIKIKKLTK